MVVCAKCHKRDLFTTQCKRPLENHSIMIAPSKLADGCDMCGKKGKLYICLEYNKIKRETNENIYCS